jgi:hypothetical protein
VLFLDQDTIVLCDPAEVVDLAQRSYTKKDVGLISLSRELRYGHGQIFFECDFPMFTGSLVRNELLERGLRFDESLFMDAGDIDFPLAHQADGVRGNSHIMDLQRPAAWD